METQQPIVHPVVPPHLSLVSLYATQAFINGTLTDHASIMPLE